jgi:hypothetical protein
MAAEKKTPNRWPKCMYKTLKWNFAASKSNAFCLNQDRFVSEVECCRECPIYEEE